MRSVGLDLGVRHIAYCEVASGAVMRRGSVRRLSELVTVVGPETEPARVAFEASREAWHVHDTVHGWGHEPLIVDTTRVKQLGVGQHGRKRDAIDAEMLALALDGGRLPLAHVLSPERRALRARLSVRSELVDMRARQVTVIRGLARAKGVLIASSTTSAFLAHLEKAALDEQTRALIAPLAATLRTAEMQIAIVDQELATLAKADPTICLCATAPGVALVVAATFVSTIDDAKRFRDAHSVASYLGLVPGEKTTGGTKQRLGAITKHGNAQARCMLVQAAWHILRAGSKDDPLHRWGTNIATKRGKKVASVAVARRLAGVLWAMWRDGTVYDAALVGRASATGLRRASQDLGVIADAMGRAVKKIQNRERRARAIRTKTSGAAMT
jgi:transposase